MSGGARRLTLLALGAFAAHLDHRALGGKARRFGRGADAARNLVIVDMHRGAARIADQEDAVVQAARMAVRDKGVRALDTADQVIRDEQVEDAVNAVRRDALAASLRHDVGNFIGAGGFADFGDRVENLGAHIGPGFARALERGLRRLGERGAAGLDVRMIMLAHWRFLRRGKSRANYRCNVGCLARARKLRAYPMRCDQCRARRLRSCPSATTATPIIVATTSLPSCGRDSAPAIMPSPKLPTAKGII